MNKLKLLNLISVLNNLSDNELKEVLTKTDNTRLLDFLQESHCSKCYKKILKHDKYGICNKLRCGNILLKGDDYYACLYCSGPLNIVCIEITLNDGRKLFRVIIHNSEFAKSFLAEKKLYDKGPLSLEKALEILQGCEN